MRRSITFCFGGLATLAVALAPMAAAQNGDIPRTPSGRPDLSGTYDVSTLTPMERPAELGEKMALTAEEAAEVAERARQRDVRRQQPSDPNRGAPPQGGDGSGGASGNVGGYNGFWIDNGDSAFQIDGQWRTSILIDPTNGRFPPRVGRSGAGRRGARRANDGTAYWLEAGLDAPGPYDNMEQRPYAERCILTFGSTSGPPMLPALYNNHKRIVQTEDTVMILIEMVHDARIVRMNAEHDPPEIKKWLGDSIGWWEGDTLVVETTNFVDQPAFRQGTGNMKVTERFRLESADQLVYTFTVEDATVWTAPFTGEYAWPRSPNKVFEYACHEANYALEGIMKGARLLEAEFRGEEPGGVANPTR
ncbi:MAG: hypothetical protein QF681_08330 [Vicinamibacterales bacterium]|nr:hypothetical protein [Vicinamibacterales bacterium]